ncbi:ATP-binding protein [Desulfomonile tiedjei]|uniref:Mg-protoporphyrin IX chelatase n=1 Tax=Desulfomonile tiedjei (strain ATCC 49306 / DSM 6799 / DCB-1) TaxID=706587 RepID=I4CEQ5_DESTA|nr:AAA family ATPase [Desulfomonile tiedjei]AFM28046.1 Mg-chelatase subunit ChlI [Desulfomonile tiedjei DSM 6799]
MSIFPFTAIVGQEQMKLALVLNVINPTIGGVLIMGEKGTAKSTAVRALAELLPQMSIAKGCSFNCDPNGFLCTSCRDTLSDDGQLHEEKRRMRVVELPLGITEDRLVGSLDIEHAIKHGEKKFEPGILAEANRNFLYVDEVNLLEDHIVDLLLDAAAMGVNTVEREGVSFVHPARFILVGTMNPEEGDLRPQFLDRFGLCVRITSLQDKAARKEILKRRAAFDANPDAFLDQWEDEQKALAQDITNAQQKVRDIQFQDESLDKIVEITAALGLDGHRGDIVIMRTAQALAALRDNTSITAEDLRDAAQLALGHRMKRLPFEEIGQGTEKLRTALAGL